ncbi:MAG: CNNM domain-containing protein [Planctomycetes bacterium]|nr:CNNM domain-containing protein [Planctomycetota bacterium]
MYAVLHMIGLLASLVLSGISAGMETALYRVSRVRLRVLSDRGSKRAPVVLRMLDNLEAMIATILINSNIAAYAGAYFLTVQFFLWGVPRAELVAAAVAAPLYFVLTESLPKQIAYNHADRAVLALARAFSVCRRILSPLLRIINLASTVLRRFFGFRGEARLGQSRRAMFLEYLSAGVAEKLLSEEQRGMAARIMDFEGMAVGDSMIPLKKLARVPETASRERATIEMARRRARFVLLTDAAGQPTGFAVTMNSLILTPGRPEDPVRASADRLEQIEAGATLPEALGLFRRRHARHALVTRQNRAVGLITTRSVLDRIAGTVS